MPVQSRLQADLELAEKLGAKQVLLWEADYIDNPEYAANRKQIQEMMRKAAGLPVGD